MKPGVLVLNFGGPRGPDELVPFLTALFDDVLPLPTPVRALAAPLVARIRARKVRSAYEHIGWSPIVPTTLEQVDAVRARLGADAPPMASGMLFTAPSVADAVARLRAEGADAFVWLALFPQYSLSTTAAAFARAEAAFAAAGLADAPIRRIESFHDHPDYVRAVAATVRRGLEGLPGDGPVHLLFSPHGLPLSFVERGDPYPEQVRETCRLAVAELGWEGPWHIGWQSRVGPQRWLEPSTVHEIERLGREGVERLVVVPVSFVGEHIETRWELDVEVAEVAHRAGIRHYARAPALGLEPAFVDSLADLVRRGLAALGA